MLPRSLPRLLKAVICCVVVFLLLCGFLASYRGRNVWAWHRKAGSVKGKALSARQIYEDAGRVQGLVSDEARVGRVVIFKSKSRDPPGSRDIPGGIDVKESVSNQSSSNSQRNVSSIFQNKTSLNTSNSHGNTRILPSLTVVFGNQFVIHSGIDPGNVTNEGRMLVIESSSKDKASQSVLTVIQSQRIPYSILNFGSGSKAGKVTLTKVVSNDGKQNLVARFSVLIFGSMLAYSQLSDLDVQLVTKYCQEFEVGLIVFTLNDPLHTKSSTVLVKHEQNVKEIRLNLETPFFRLLRHVTSSIPVDHVTWSTLVSRDNSHLPVLVGMADDHSSVNLALLDHGHKDDIKKVWLGGDPKNWIVWLIFLDSVFYLSKGSIHIPLERYIQVDIDDIFTGKSGIRLKHGDIDSLITTQHWLANRIPGFRFYLGFSGDNYQQGTAEEKMGDQCLVGNASHFQWFGHMPTHLQPHKFDSVPLLVKQMDRNRQFARKYNLSLVPGYVVSPHHSGVYPVHLPLFEAWKEVFNVTVTSTEGYPSNEVKERRGFIFKDIMVLPRQTCTLFTTINLYSQYSHGYSGLRSTAEGGMVFQTILANQFSIFMTHMSNYGSDRLANRLWRMLVEFVAKWTNIQLKAVPPLQLAKLYFSAYPDDVQPVWKPPCLNPKHKAIWNANKPCNTLPNVVILGPTKSGVNVLHKWLALHPLTLVKGNSSRLSVGSTKFFTEKYLNGLDWYMDQFEEPKEGHIVVDSVSGSAMADRSIVTRINALLPQAKLIFVLQHFMRLAQAVCQKNQLDKFVRSSEATCSCLEGSDYTVELKTWLHLYKPEQILVVDSEEFISNPVKTLNQIQGFLELNKKIDYSQILTRNPNLGYFCPSGSDGQPACHTVHPRRNRQALDSNTERLLYQKLRAQYPRLKQFVQSLKVPLPKWLAN